MAAQFSALRALTGELSWLKILFMNMRAEPQYLEWPQVVPVSPEENEDLRRNCTAIMARGGETGEIAADILRINHELTSLIEKMDAFLKR